MPAEQTIIDEAVESIDRMQSLDPDSLVQSGRLGNEHNFSAAVAPAKRLKDLYSQLDTKSLSLLPTKAVQDLKQRANSNYNIIKEILEFNVDAGNVKGRINDLVSKLDSSYDDTMQIAATWIAYFSTRSGQVAELETRARDVLQSISDKQTKVEEAIGKLTEKANGALEAARKAAEEQGVTQQARYFKKEAKRHELLAEDFRKWARNFGIAGIVYVVVATVIFMLGLVPVTETHELIQWTVSKLLIFGVLATGLAICLRGYMSHKHNQTVNEHRQSALQTYEALVRAANGEDSRDIVLTHAAACIFEAMPTGFIGPKDAADGSHLNAVAGLVSAGKG